MAMASGPPLPPHSRGSPPLSSGSEGPPPARPARCSETRSHLRLHLHAAHAPAPAPGGHGPRRLCPPAPPARVPGPTEAQWAPPLPPTCRAAMPPSRWPDMKYRATGPRAGEEPSLGNKGRRVPRCLRRIRRKLPGRLRPACSPDHPGGGLGQRSPEKPRVGERPLRPLGKLGAINAARWPSDE